MHELRFCYINLLISNTYSSLSDNGNLLLSHVLQLLWVILRCSQEREDL